jgi:hypothetical protein
MSQRRTIALSATQWHGSGWLDVSSLAGDALRRFELSATALSTTQVEIWASSDNSAPVDYTGATSAAGARPPTSPGGKLVGTIQGPDQGNFVYPQPGQTVGALANTGAQATYYNFIRISTDTAAVNAIVVGEVANGGDGAGTPIRQGGQALAVPMVIGTTDAQSLTLEADGVTGYSQDASGNTIVGTTATADTRVQGALVQLLTTVGQQAGFTLDEAGNVDLGTNVGDTIISGVEILLRGLGSAPSTPDGIVLDTSSPGSNVRVNAGKAAFLVTAAEALVQVASMAIAGVPSGGPDASALLDLQVDGAHPKGFRPPNLTGTQRDAIPSPAHSLDVYNSTVNQRETNIGTPGAPVWAPMSYQVSAGPIALSGGQATVSNVWLTTRSQIVVTVGNPAPGAGDLTARYDVLETDRTNGFGTGAFKISALKADGTLNNLDASTNVRWSIQGQ